MGSEREVSDVVSGVHERDPYVFLAVRRRDSDEEVRGWIRGGESGKPRERTVEEEAGGRGVGDFAGCVHVRAAGCAAELVPDSGTVGRGYGAPKPSSPRSDNRGQEDGRRKTAFQRKAPVDFDWGAA